MIRNNSFMISFTIMIWSFSALFSVYSQVADPDRIYYNANVITVDDRFSYAQALAITGDKFSVVGTNEIVRRLAGPSTKEINLNGLTVIPGLTDNHLHFAGGGPGVDLSRTRTMAELLLAIAERVSETPKGKIVMTNMDWHEAQLKEQQLPLRRDLDTVAPDHPVIAVRGGHTYILNSMALKKWNISKETPIPKGGRISLYPDGTLNGELIDAAKSLVTLPPRPKPSLVDKIKQQVAQYNKLHAAGLTAVRHPGGTIEEYRMLKKMQQQGLLTMRVTQLLRFNSYSPQGDPEELKAAVMDWDLEPNDGDAQLRLGGIKLAVDGGFEGAFMREPYPEPWGKGGTFYGLQTISQDRYNSIVRVLNTLGWRVFTHAVGDAAIDEVLAGYEAANADKSIIGKRWGIEHALLPQPDHFPRIKDLGLYISTQNHLYLAGPVIEKYWGRKRADRTGPIKAYLDNNIPVSAGTDAPVVPYPPLWAFYHFVTRDTISGGIFGAEQKISREDALRLFTRNHWYLTFEENVKGTIENGRYADLVVLEDNIMTVPAERIPELKVLLTMVGGKVVYQNDSFEDVLEE